MFEIDTDISKALPEFYQGIADYEEIMDTEEAELETLAAFISAVHDNFFVQTLDESAVQDWESLLGIADTGEQGLEFRRQRILNRISTRPPFSLEFLYRKLDEFIGPGKWEVAVDYDDYTLRIESAAESQDYAVEVAITINQIKPAHIVYINVPYVSDTLLLNETVLSAGLSQNYRLGGWALGAKPFVNEGEERVEKVATTRSLSGTLIGAVANFVSGDVSKARINGSSVITSITKTVTDGLLTVIYSVPEGTVSAITKVELLDSSNNVLTESTVYIPATSAIEMKHRILTQEGV